MYLAAERNTFYYLNINVLNIKIRIEVMIYRRFISSPTQIQHEPQTRSDTHKVYNKGRVRCYITKMSVSYLLLLHIIFLMQRRMSYADLLNRQRTIHHNEPL